MTKIKLTKLSGKPDASIPVGYWAEGFEHPMLQPKIGDVYIIYGPMVTSLKERFDHLIITQLKKIRGRILTTQNSRWRREVL